MRRIILVLLLLGLAGAGFALTTCNGNTENRAEKYYEPVDPAHMTVTVPLLTETDLVSP